MIKILFFAQLRERLGVAELTQDTLPDTIGALRNELSQQSGLWAELLQKERCLAALNQEIVADNAKLNSGDEVAFFPPVTGG
ncbi:molybdopterin converting factor subunit 1 [Alteromonas sp. a30]|uniref:molybdopterin converting factor subunit 1 n=1 Tax=Alteromonas sp. a30 TaxID=2730917 RepID=UPI00228009A3|nr:molybdopterin converting factor subunit 1 [Alteromonas sp. a30]MCY7296411.1 molybdopterin converting factor subunit 1 [Alteromonas sp. a30]